MKQFLLIIFLPISANADNCWGQYEPNDHNECEYEFLTEEDKQIDEYIRDNLTAFWTRNKDDRVRED